MPNILPKPTGLTASYTETSTTLTWNAVVGADYYIVNRYSTAISTTTATTFTDTTAGQGTNLVYRIVAAQYKNGLYPSLTLYPGTTLYPAANTAAFDSAPATIMTHNPKKLATPHAITTQTATTLTATWEAVQYASSYTIQYTVNGGSAQSATTSNTTFTITELEPNDQINISIWAVATGYYTSDADVISVVILPRQNTPTIWVASQVKNNVTIKIKSNQAYVTTVLLRDGEEVTTYHTSILNPLFSWTFTDIGLNNSQTYVYTVYNKGDTTHNDSLSASVTVLISWAYSQVERQIAYLNTLKTPFIKLCRLRFLYPNGTTAYALDNNPKNRRSKAFIADGTVNANMQNGQRISATVTIANASSLYDFGINTIWFGQQIALDEGIILPNGQEYWRQTGVFVIDNPSETINPATNTVTYNLVDKWSDLDGTLDGNLEGTYEVPVDTNIFAPIATLLSEDKGNGYDVDNVAPVFTEYFNSKTQDLPDGTSQSMVLSPYTLTVDGDGGTIGEVILGLGGMVNAWVGYDNTGRLRVEPSQDDILDAQKAVLYRFNPNEITLLGMAYTVKKEDLYNDYIVVGEQMDDYSQPGGRAQNLDPRSDTNVNIIGRKTKRESASGYATTQQCVDLAEWRLKRSGVLQKAVSVSCSQMIHIELNYLVEIVRTDKPGSPTERHLIQGFSRPLAYNGQMTINCVSVNDLPIATVTPWPEPEE